MGKKATVCFDGSHQSQQYQWLGLQEGDGQVMGRLKQMTRKRSSFRRVSLWTQHCHCNLHSTRYCNFIECSRRTTSQNEDLAQADGSKACSQVLVLDQSKIVAPAGRVLLFLFLRFEPARPFHTNDGRRKRTSTAGVFNGKFKFDQCAFPSLLQFGTKSKTPPPPLFVVDCFITLVLSPPPTPPRCRRLP